MATPPNSPEELIAAVEAVEAHGSQTAAAEAQAAAPPLNTLVVEGDEIPGQHCPTCDD